ncbi:hypothetical protein Ahu01nite_091750 [Winogradskya humida]|uniref:Uncharacterized protein n=1 Tax=Winogradskya humida TaxID=113566 RepID=A0ABQ4A5F8_9ACTN|nr:hypothetical protein Ahu01nite_091750 [Actinoplanes humidus]
MGDVVREAVTARDEAGGGAADADLVGHARPGREHLGRDADIERLGTLQNENGDTMQTHEQGGYAREGTPKRAREEG